MVTTGTCLNDNKWQNEVLDEAWVTQTKQPSKYLHTTTAKYPVKTQDEDKSTWRIIPDRTTGSIVPTPATNAKPDFRVNSGSSRFLAPIHGHHWVFEGRPVSPDTTSNTSFSVEGTFLWAVALLGTVANLAVVLTTALARNIRRPLHVLVGTLGLTDLCVTLLYIPTYAYFLMESSKESTKKQEPERSERWQLCVASKLIFAEIASVTLSIKTLIAIYLFVFTRFSKEVANSIFRISHTIAFIITAWLINFVVLFVPHFLGWSFQDIYPNGFVCYKSQSTNGRGTFWTSESFNTPHALIMLSTHLIQLVVIFFCFAEVHRAILRGRLLSQQHKLEDSESRMNYDRASKTTVLMFFSLCICWLPVYLANVADHRHTRLPLSLHRVSMDLLMTKSAMNPFIYLYGLKSLRHLAKLLCLCKCRSREQNLKFHIARTSTYYTGESKSTADVVNV